MAVDADERVELDTLLAEGRHVADTVAAKALARNADEIALADPRASGWASSGAGCVARSPVPVVG